MLNRIVQGLTLLSLLLFIIGIAVPSWSITTLNRVGYVCVST
jgi:hypothetical protein